MRPEIRNRLKMRCDYLFLNDFYRSYFLDLGRDGNVILTDL